jgi:hypothetical protein
MATELYRTRSLAFMGELNQYQRENLSKLMADLFMILLMAVLVLPWLADETEELDPETGKTKVIQGERIKHQWGASAHKAASNALADMALVMSLPSAMQSLLPGFGVFGGAVKNVVNLINASVTGEETEPFFKKTAKQWGIGRTGIMTYETFSGNTF